MRLRGKDSNLDYLIQSYRPLVSVRITLLGELVDFQGNSAAADGARDVP